DPTPDVRPHAIPVETCDVQAELLGVLQEIVVLERLLGTEQQRVHRPETVLQGSSLGGSGRPERVRMDLDEREVPEGETHAPAQLLLDPFDPETLAGSAGTRSRRTRERGVRPSARGRGRSPRPISANAGPR